MLPSPLESEHFLPQQRHPVLLCTNSISASHVMSSCQVPLAGASTLCWFLLNAHNNLCQKYIILHFADEEAEVKEFKYLAQVIQLVSDKAGTPPGSLVQTPFFQVPPSYNFEHPSCVSLQGSKMHQGKITLFILVFLEFSYWLAHKYAVNSGWVNTRKLPVGFYGERGLQV